MNFDQREEEHRRRMAAARTPEDYAAAKRERDAIPDQQQRFAEGLRKLIALSPSLQLDLDWQTGIAVIASLQLALRHPGNTGDTARTVRELLDRVIDRIDRLSPELADLLRLGDNPEHDVPSAR